MPVESKDDRKFGLYSAAYFSSQIGACKNASKKERKYPVICVLNKNKRQHVAPTVKLPNPMTDTIENLMTDTFEKNTTMKIQLADQWISGFSLGTAFFSVFILVFIITKIVQTWHQSLAKLAKMGTCVVNYHNGNDIFV